MSIRMDHMTWFGRLVPAMLLVVCFAHNTMVVRALALNGLNPSLAVTVSLSNNNVSSDFIARAGIDQLHVKWELNTSMQFTDQISSTYKMVKMQLCFAPPSQFDRPWRKRNDADLSKDKTCTFDLGETVSYATLSRDALVSKSVPAAQYFVRVYVLNDQGMKVAYGETHYSNSIGTFSVEPISGRHISIDIAAAVFSAFSMVSLFTFYFMERKFFTKKP